MDARLSCTVTLDTPLGQDLTFRSMGGFEALSQPFVYELDVLSTRSDIKAAELLDQPVTVHLDLSGDGDELRHWNARVVRFQYLSTDDDDMSRYRLTLRPWLWQLTLSTDCRVFQNMSIPDIVAQVFRDRSFTDFETALFGTYSQREYVVQYRETDFQFVSRLLEREGIYYYFRHEDGKHTLVMADSAAAHSAVAGCESLPFVTADEHRDSTMQYVRRWMANAQLETGAYAHADFDFTKPAVALYASLRSADDVAQPQLRAYDYPGGFTNFADAESYARLRLEQVRREASGCTGDSNAKSLTVGATFELVDHPREDQNQTYLVVSARYRLRGEEVRTGQESDVDPFACTFAVIDAKTTFRPPFSAPKPTVRGPQTAIVVGPSGEEIWTDQYGRIKVQFHWDRQGQNDENSSCWVRVAQAWAGTNWGSIHIPRIGQEVIVDFFEGDPDRPIITGRVYNASNMPPYALPANATQSGTRSRSSKDGNVTNANEIRFEDARGSEELFVQAEKDLNVVVKNNETSSVGVDSTLTVGKDRSLVVQGDESVAVAGNRAVSTAGAETTSVGLAQALSVAGSRTVAVAGAASTTIGGDASRAVAGATQETLQGDVTRTMGGSVRTSTAGDTLLRFASDYTERHAGHRTVVVGSGAARRTAVVHVEGNGRAYASKSLEVEVLESFALVCGDSQLILSPRGITLSSPAISFISKAVDATVETFTVAASGDLTLGGKTATVETAGAQLALDASTASLKASQVKLGSGSGNSAQTSDKPVTVTHVQMKDAQGKPRANARVLLLKGGKDGEQRMTVLDENGMLELIGDDSYQIVFPDDPTAK
jgi:type VI secretion system secreted protein VgrG